MIQFVLKILSVVLASVQPFVFLYFIGEQQSLSSYWLTPLQPLFIITNAITSYFLFTTNHWQFPALILLGVTAFSVEMYPTVHNILAAVFFIIVVYPLWKHPKFRFYLTPYLLGGLVALGNMFYGEIICILTICAYHLHVMFYMRILHKK